MRWSAPTDAGVCCERFRVMSSQLSVPIDTVNTSFTLTNVEQQESAFVSVRCMDQIGTMGPEAVYRPSIGMLNFSILLY